MQLARLGWVLAAIAAIVFLVVMAVLLRPLRRAGRTTHIAAREHPGLFLIASAVPALVLLAMYALSLGDAGHLTASTAIRANIRIMGYQR